MYAGSGLTEQSVGRLAFDDEPLLGATAAELDHDLVLSVMREYRAKLGRAAVTAETLPALLREQGLMVSVGGEEAPTRGCVLLFGKNPQTRFPHAVLSATVGGKKRVVFSGNLIRQRLALLEWLEGSEVNPTLRVKRRTVHEEKPAYPPRALVELLVNMLVHRDYQVSEPAQVSVEPVSR